MLRGIVQFDTLNEVNIRLSDGSKAFNYDGYTNIIFKVLKADGTAYIDSKGENVIATSPVDGIITVNLTGQSTTAAGLCQSVLEVYSGDGKMTTARFNYEVFEDLDLDEAVESTTEYPALQNLMLDLSELEARITEAEAARVTAEAARASEASGYVAQAQEAAKNAEMWAKAAQDITDGDYATRAELESVEAGAAPSGYGLGAVNGFSLSTDMNDATRSGYYYVTSARVANNPKESDGILVVYAGASNQVIQDYYPHQWVGTKLERRKVAGTWKPWEYVNPPMDVGVEYRTTERYNSRPIYRKIVNFGALPNATSKTMSAGFEGGYIVGIDGVFSTNQGHCFHSHPNISGIVGLGTDIIITTTADMSAYNVSVMIKYYKAAD